MTNELRSRDLPLDESCILQTVNPALHEVVQFLAWIQKLFYAKGYFYFYQCETGRYKRLLKDEEWTYISSFLPPGLVNKISSSDIKKIIERLKYCEEIKLDIKEFNKYEHLINAENVVIDTTTGELLPKSSEYYFTSFINAKYNPDLTIDDAPTLKEYCKTSLRDVPSSIKLLLQSKGYLYSNYTVAKKAFFYIGQRNSGKSRTLEFDTRLVGEENVCGIAINKLGNRFNIAEFSRNKLNIHAELPTTPLQEIETFKNLVGGDRLTAEDKGKDPFHFKNKCKLLFAGNNMPNLKTQDTTRAFISRIIFLIFPDEIPASDWNLNLVDDLWEERDVIFSLAMKELFLLVRNNFQFEVPELSKRFLSSYTDENNSIECFINEGCVFGTNQKIFSRDLYKSYSHFCKDNSLFAFGESAFLKAVARLDNVYRDRIILNGERCRGFIGINVGSTDYMQDSQMADCNSQCKNLVSSPSKFLGGNQNV